MWFVLALTIAPVTMPSVMSGKAQRSDTCPTLSQLSSDGSRKPSREGRLLLSTRSRRTYATLAAKLIDSAAIAKMITVRWKRRSDGRSADATGIRSSGRRPAPSEWK